MLIQKPSGAPLLEEAKDKARRYIIMFVAVSGIINLLSLTIPLYILTVFDRVLSSQSVDTLAFLTMAALIALATHSMLDGLRSYLFQRMAEWWASFIAPHVLARSIERRLTDDGFRLEMLREVAQLKNFFGSGAMTTLLDLPWLPLFAIIAFLIHPLIGAVALLGAAVLGLIAFWNQRRVRKAVKTSVIASQKELRFGESLIRNAEVIDSMGMATSMLGRWRGLLENELEVNGRIVAVGTVSTGFSRFARQVVQIALYGVAATLVIANQLTPGAMIAGSIIAARLLQPIEGTFNHWRALTMARESYRRLQEFFDRAVPRAMVTSLPKPKGRLRADRVTLQVPRRPLPILRNVNFAISPGEQLAIMGPAASGKTSLVKTILGAVQPTAGVVRLDGADVFGLDRAEFGQHCGYLPQGVELFDGTVAENIARFSPADDEAIVRAARIAGCHDLILSLPDGYDTELREGVATLSGGQAQQIALARAVFGKPSIVVLDEPNANLDMRGERALRNCLVRLRKLKTTVIVVSHRRALLSVVDKLLVLDQGQVRNFGPVGDVVRNLAKRTADDEASIEATLKGKPKTPARPTVPAEPAE
jgi:PrtD family type I secretion system ABC transporter